MRNLSYENEFCMHFHFHANQSHFHKNSFALRLALKQRHKGIFAKLVLNKQGTGYEYPSPQLVASNMADKTGKTKYGSAFAWKVVKSPHFSVIQDIFDWKLSLINLFLNVIDSSIYSTAKNFKTLVLQFCLGSLKRSHALNTMRAEIVPVWSKHCRS